MKKTPLLNAALSEVIASMGHTDTLVIGDAGLPVPPGVRCIDLALTHGVPGFIETLRVVLTELQVEKAIIAEETGKISPHILNQIQEMLPAEMIQNVSHEALKGESSKACAIVRTGEFTPYANIILVSGVVF